MTWFLRASVCLPVKGDNAYTYLLSHQIVPRIKCKNAHKRSNEVPDKGSINSYHYNHFVKNFSVKSLKKTKGLKDKPRTWHFPPSQRCSGNQSHQRPGTLAVPPPFGKRGDSVGRVAQAQGRFPSSAGLRRRPGWSCPATAAMATATGSPLEAPPLLAKPKVLTAEANWTASK